MARVFAGDISKVDKEVLEAVRRLPSDFWVFAEFNIDRNIDWLIIREVPAQEKSLRLSTMIVTELKRSSSAVRAMNMNGPWEKMGDSGFEEIQPSGPESNYYQQVLKATDALQQWLWSNQRFFLQTQEPRPIGDFKPWPDLLILSPPGVMHQLPLRPPTGYGGFWLNLDSWVNHLLSWNPRAGWAFTAEELSKLASFFGLKPLEAPAGVAQENGVEEGPKEIADFMGWLLSLDERITRLEQSLSAANRRELTRTYAPPPVRYPAAPRISRPLADKEKEAMVYAVTQIVRLGKSRAIPSVLEEMNMRLGYNLKDTSYNEFGSARNLFDNAREQGMVKYGPFRGPNPTIYLPTETPPEG